MLHIAPHHTHSRATKEKEPPTGCEIGRRVARERERVRESSWWMLQILGEKREEGEKKVDDQEVKICLRFGGTACYSFSVKWSPVFNLFFSIYFHILKLMIPENFAPPKWLIHRGTKRWSQRASPWKVPRCRQQALPCIKQSRDAHFETTISDRDKCSDEVNDLINQFHLFTPTPAACKSGDKKNISRELKALA